MIVTTADFIGYYQVSFGIYDTPKLQSAIDRYEKYYLIKLLGLTMGNYFIADLVDGEPVDTDFLTIFNELQYEDENCLHTSKGIKDILIACIFYHFISEKAVHDAQSGVVVGDSEVAKNVAFDNVYRLAEIRWNSMLESWEAIQKYCIENSSVYPDFKGQHEYPRLSGLV